MSARSQRRVRCLLCDKQPTLNNFTTHLSNMHARETRGRNRKLFYAELFELSPPTSQAIVPAPVEPEPESELASLGPEDLDDIVMAVAEQVVGPSGQFPVADLPALFAWRSATSTFLRHVHDRQTAGRG